MHIESYRKYICIYIHKYLHVHIHAALMCFYIFMHIQQYIHIYVLMHTHLKKPQYETILKERSIHPRAKYVHTCVLIMCRKG